MIQLKKKKAFSLIEVMIIFTVMAVVMAASIPVITRKTITTEEVSKHGMFQCVSQDGKVIQTLYNSSGELVGTPKITDGSCTFDKIPKKVKYFKIDMYSAGAGGTKYANMKVEHHVMNNVAIRLRDLPAILRGRSVDDIISEADSNVQDSEDKWENSGVEFPIADNQLIDVLAQSFRDKVVRRSLYVGDGGSGSDAAFQYITPSETVCLAAIDGVNHIEGRLADTADEMNEYAQKTWAETTKKTIYNAMKFIVEHIDDSGAITAYDDAIATLNKIFEKKEFGEYKIADLPYSMIQEYYIARDVNTDKSKWYKKVKKAASQVKKTMDTQYSGSPIVTGQTDDYDGLNDESPEPAVTISGMPDIEYLYVKLLNTVYVEDINEKINVNGNNILYKSGYNMLARRPGKYEDRQDLMFPVTDSGFQAIRKQLNDYCATKFPEYYTAANQSTGVKNASGAYINMPPSNPADGTLNMWGIRPNTNENVYQNYYMLSSEYSNNQSAYSQIKQKGGRGGIGGALVMEYRMGNAPARYFHQWSCKRGKCTCQPATDNSSARTLSYYSDLYNWTLRDSCGSQGGGDVFGLSHGDDGIIYQTGITPHINGPDFTSLDEYIDGFRARNGADGVNDKFYVDNVAYEGSILSHDTVEKKGKFGDLTVGSTENHGEDSITEVGKVFFRIPQFSKPTTPFESDYDDMQSYSVYRSKATGGKSGIVGYETSVYNPDWPVWRVWTGDENGEKPDLLDKDISENTSGLLRPQATHGVPATYTQPIDSYPNDQDNNNTHDYIRVENTTPAEYRTVNASGVEVRFGGARNAHFSEPGLMVSGDYWTKEFQLGPSGGNGYHKTYSVYGLGDSCTMTVPGTGGIPLDYRAELEKYGNEKDLVAHYEGLRSQVGNGGLAVQIVCTKNEQGTQKEVLNKILKGGQYGYLSNLSDWSSNTEEPLPAENNDNIFAEISSRFSQTIKKLFEGFKTINPHLAQGGHGTILEDKCKDVSSGKYTTAIYEFEGSTPDPATMSVTGRLGVVAKYTNNNSGRLDDNTDCFNRGTLENAGTAEKDGYRLYKIDGKTGGIERETFTAGQGNGGAIIITW